ncbi:MAG TPA: HAMP domain-containing sensor histidine kinase, partial [Geomonas sp.]|nr:HAMP domain-containing sensor histidine kinase [Geomonas sp.]
HYPGVKSDGKTLTAEARVLVGDRLYWMWSAATPLYNLLGKKVGGIQSLRDVTELRKSEQERSRLEAQLHHASMMEALMRQLGHDLKTPLTPLCALLPMIGRKCQDPDLTRMLDICQQSARQIQALSSKAQELVRLSCQQTPLHQGPVLLREAVDGCLAGCGSLFLQRGIDCRNQVAPGLAVLAAADQLNLLLDNLLSNAARFASEGGQVAVSALVEGETAVVSVADDGIGLQPGETDRIFEEFFKVDAARHDLNTQGLGLAICKRIVLNHQGRIWAESRGAGLGTTVSFTLRLSGGERLRGEPAG